MWLTPLACIVSRALQSASITRRRRPSSLKDGQAFSNSASEPPSASQARRAFALSILCPRSCASLAAFSSCSLRYASCISLVYWPTLGLLSVVISCTSRCDNRCGSLLSPPLRLRERGAVLCPLLWLRCIQGGSQAPSVPAP